MQIIDCGSQSPCITAIAVSLRRTASCCARVTPGNTLFTSLRVEHIGSGLIIPNTRDAPSTDFYAEG